MFIYVKKNFNPGKNNNGKMNQIYLVKINKTSYNTLRFEDGRHCSQYAGVLNCKLKFFGRGSS